MRVTIGLDQLTPAQWAWLHENLPVAGSWGQNTIRMCVTIGEDRHVEMPPREFIGLLGQLQLIEKSGSTAGQDIEALISAVFAQHSEPEPEPATVLCEHRRPVMSEQPSFVLGAPPVKVHTDGCRTFGPYPRFDW